MRVRRTVIISIATVLLVSLAAILLFVLKTKSETESLCKKAAADGGGGGMKTALITGAGGGIGAAAAKRLAADGFTPVLHSNTTDCTAAAEALHGIAVRADLSD